MLGIAHSLTSSLRICGLTISLLLWGCLDVILHLDINLQLRPKDTGEAQANSS